MDGIDNLDWNLIRAFLAVAETGSLSGAARHLGLSQPTLGRQIQALEQAVGATLFHRQPRGLKLAEAGHALIGPARAMDRSAAALRLAAAGTDHGLAGTVRVTASAMTACYHMPRLLADLRRSHPEIQIELVATDTTENLLYREADIAVRMYRPRQLDVVTKHLGDFELGLYGARSLIDRAGCPEGIDAILAAGLLGYDRNDEILQGLRAMGVTATRDTFPIRCDDNVTHHALLRAGCGFGFAQVAVAEADPDLVRVLPDLPLPRLPVWLTCPEAVRRSPRVRRVWSALEQGLSPMLIRPAA